MRQVLRHNSLCLGRKNLEYNITPTPHHFLLFVHYKYWSPLWYPFYEIGFLILLNIPPSIFTPYLFLDKNFSVSPLQGFLLNEILDLPLLDGYVFRPISVKVRFPSRSFSGTPPLSGLYKSLLYFPLLLTLFLLLHLPLSPSVSDIEGPDNLE